MAHPVYPIQLIFFAFWKCFHVKWLSCFRWYTMLPIWISCWIYSQGAQWAYFHLVSIPIICFGFEKYFHVRFFKLLSLIYNRLNRAKFLNTISGSTVSLFLPRFNSIKSVWLLKVFSCKVVNLMWLIYNSSNLDKFLNIFSGSTVSSFLLKSKKCKLFWLLKTFSGNDVNWFPLISKLFSFGLYINCVWGTS